MTDKEYTYITGLLKKFFEGATTAKEEKELYVFFRRKDLPGELEKYRGMFAWYDTLESAAGHEVQTAPDLEKPGGKSRRWITGGTLRSAWIGIAASLALIVTAGVVHLKARQIPEEYLAYEGSYIVRDGKKITDLSIVVPEILRTEKLFEERMKALDANIDRAEKMSGESMVDMLDFPDERVRKLAREILSE